MSSSPIFRARAREDMAAAYRWYEDRRTGLGELLLLEVHRCIGYILKSPGGFQRIHGPFRQAPVDHFPFVVIYRSSGSQVVVMRIFHTKQHPRKKTAGKGS